MDIQTLKNKVIENKIEVLKLCAHAGQGHVTSAFSCAEIVIALYYELMNIDPINPNWENRDRFVMSKNHASVMLYPVLKDIGIIDEKIDFDFDGNGSPFGGHSKRGVSGIDFSGGSLGIGIGVATGMAYSAKIRGRKHYTYCILGDGECYEGSVWESLLFAGHNQLQNLVVYIDRNMQDMTDFTEEILKLSPMQDKLEAFGFEVAEIDGHNLIEIIETTNRMKQSGIEKPKCIICNTIKGNGVSAIHNKRFKHGMALTGEDLEKAISELKEGLSYAV